MRRYLALIPLLVVAGLVLAFWLGMQRDPNVLPSTLVGKPAPAFNLPDLHDPDRRITEDIFRGEVSLLNVWGTWCPGCHQEHPLLMDFARNTDVPVYGLDWNIYGAERDERQAALEWLERLGNPYRAVAYDATGRVGTDYGVYGAPETFVIDAEGVIRHRHVGVLTPDTLYGEILPLVQRLRGER